ncbi:3-methyladenine DNA glycosylase [Candidatus Wolfebacteria bacterium CG10_big_fil_rev_8_21_14_0_10_31_9]|uniref:Putative 3-methyladenine DNA glycosylase n=1 Tax=Candidatus Wolfebacteria bacterium CG10_big_fil_rev_8_21_14_0_10_31_9 TaxID=1975070 RepID=A0A2H0RCB9_9BACT|nr:MAG: 3-methyladenine DNA glycosylase [Candidatus Wolfebacteria bacterium CG10_big_fil_rev_8_21_14_0_10_31_9]
MKKILPEKFFQQPTLKIAHNLLGKFLVRKYRGKRIYLLITEVEAYDGFNDKASHASRGKTLRNSPMFETGGIFYIYFTYGMHYMLNIVTDSKDYPSAILIRAGIATSMNNLSIQQFNNKSIHINGPAKLTKFLKINKKINGLRAIRKNNLWFEDHGIKIKKSQIITKPRTGVDYAGPIWSKKLYKFSINPKTF